MGATGQGEIVLPEPKSDHDRSPIREANNAGHIRVFDGSLRAHMIPSGILYPGKQNIIGNG